MNSSFAFILFLLFIHRCAKRRREGDSESSKVITCSSVNTSLGFIKYFSSCAVVVAAHCILCEHSFHSFIKPHIYYYYTDRYSQMNLFKIVYHSNG